MLINLLKNKFILINKMDVHLFDHKINFEFYINLAKNSIYYENKEFILKEFLTKINNSKLNDMIERNIYDNTNKVYVKDLIFLLAVYNFNKNVQEYTFHNFENFILQELDVQLNDLENQTCPEGKSIRISQILNFLYN